MIDVFEDNIFIIDATVKLCLSDSESCVVDIPILQRKVVTKPFCQSVIGFQIPGNRITFTIFTDMKKNE
jgi:hypothetical protein